MPALPLPRAQALPCRSVLHVKEFCMLKSLTIKSRLIFLTGFLGVQLVIGGIIGLVSLHNTNDAMKSMYDNRLVALGHLDEVIRGTMENRSLIATAILGREEDIARQMDMIDANLRQISERWEAFLATNLTPEERRLRSEEHTSELQSRENLVCRLLLEKKK